MASVSGIESTPNPSSFLVRLSEPLDVMESMEGSLVGKTFTASTTGITSKEITQILDIEGVKSVYAMATPPALTVNKEVAGKWEEILPLVITAIVQEDPAASSPDGNSSILQELLATVLDTSNKDKEDAALSGQVRLRLQASYRIPIQLEATGFLGTVKRAKAASKFSKSMQDLMAGADADASSNVDFFAGRKWIDQGVRYLDIEENADDRSEQDQEEFEIDAVLQSELENLDAAYSTERLDTIVSEALLGDNTNEKQQETISGDIDMEDLDIQKVDHYCDLADQGDMEALSVLAKFVYSHKGSMAARRDALAFLGGTGDIVLAAAKKEVKHEQDYGTMVVTAVLSALEHEKNPIMRRTAGDALSDLGDDRAVPSAAKALLEDRSKLVQWRAARILGELGSSDVLGVLKQASFSDQYAFEVAFEIKDALRKVKGRIQQQNEDPLKGNAGSGANTATTGPVWKQIQQGMDSS